MMNEKPDSQDSKWQSFPTLFMILHPQDHYKNRPVLFLVYIDLLIHLYGSKYSLAYAAQYSQILKKTTTKQKQKRFIDGVKHCL